MNKKDWEHRWRKCREYLVKAGNLPAAVKLAKTEHFAAPTAVWITALSKMLGEKARRD